MEKFSRSQSTRDQAPPRNMSDLRSYSTSDYGAPPNPDDGGSFKERKMKKSRVSASSKNLSFNLDPELQRKKRVAGYKAYGMEGKMKNTFRKSFRWVKDACTSVVHGFW